ncbi:MAG: peptide chain release factor 2 [Desulfobacteraceae bacterium]|nr:peptide chain release factor 2 [Desulfobacteraceae bacterium]MCF8095929.1 peptide chain release factor 2 [Desulfobacteraceae bacterium]
MSEELRSAINELYKKIDQLKGYLDIPGTEKRLAEIESMISEESFWDEPDKAAKILRERSRLNERLEGWRALYKEVEDCATLLELAEEEQDEDSFQEVRRQVDSLEKRIHSFSISLMLNSEDDNRNAIVSINAGAGGTEAQDWAEMLFRMYHRWCGEKGYKVEVMDLQPGDEAGIKSVTFTAKGEPAFGYLKVETGVHRLVRISPFNAGGKRHTSFASVFVYPEIDDEIVVDIDEKDLRIDTYRASGAGGQHVNKTSSAVRITHEPTGIVVQCQQEKSQIRNRELAMRVLRARLYQLEKQKQDQKMQAIHETKGEIAWGNQIRSYVLHPYQMVKDHRVNMDIGNVNAVLDGWLDPFIEAVLLSAVAGSPERVNEPA